MLVQTLLFPLQRNFQSDRVPCHYENQSHLENFLFPDQLLWDLCGEYVIEDLHPDLEPLIDAVQSIQ